jgi:hypothetical protein
MEKTDTGKNLPEMKFRAGAVTATVWQNTGMKDGEATSYNTISIERSYKDKNDAWQSTNSMRINDLPRAALVLKKAYEYLVLNQQNN